MIPEYIEYMRLAQICQNADNELTQFLKKIDRICEPYFYRATNSYKCDWEIRPSCGKELIRRLGYTFEFENPEQHANPRYFLTREDGEKREISNDMYTQVFGFLHGLYFDVDGELQDINRKVHNLIPFSDKQRIKDILVEEYNKCFPKTQEQLK